MYLYRHGTDTTKVWVSRGGGGGGGKGVNERRLGPSIKRSPQNFQAPQKYIKF